MALNHNGTDQYVTLANESAFDFTKDTAFSFFIWINFSALTTIEAIISKLDGSAPFSGWELWHDSGGTGTDVHVYMINTFSTNLTRRNSTNMALANNIWACIGFTYDGAGNNNAVGVKIYKNNTLTSMSSTFDSLTASILNNFALKIGARSGDNILDLTARTAHCVITNNVLSANSIKGMANGVNPFVLDNANIVSYLPLLGHSSAEPDFKKQSNIGTTTSATKYAGNPPADHLSNYISGYC